MLHFEIAITGKEIMRFFAAIAVYNETIYKYSCKKCVRFFYFFCHLKSKFVNSKSKLKMRDKQMILFWGLYSAALFMRC